MKKVKIKGTQIEKLAKTQIYYSIINHKKKNKFHQVYLNLSLPYILCIIALINLKIIPKKKGKKDQK